MKMNKLLASVFMVCMSAATSVAYAQESDPTCSSTSTANVPRIGEVTSQTHFAQAIEDLPLMPGLEVDGGEDILFIFGSNRIARTTAKGRVDIDSVYYFYQDTLPQLGWKQISLRLYERGAEKLHVDASSANADGMTYVTFEVEPQ